MEKDSGINWHCDNCKALLNSQSGFNSHANFWKCEACGHQNCISDNKVVQVRKIYKCPVCRYTLSDQSKIIDKGVFNCERCGIELYKIDDEIKVNYECPYCDGKLYDQYWFNEYPEYKCSHCNTELFKENNVYKILYKCPNCNEKLNQQYAFKGAGKCICSNCQSKLYKKDNKYDIYYECPSCKKVLNDQPYFTQQSFWDCPNCSCELEKSGSKYIKVENFANKKEEKEELESIEVHEYRPVNYDYIRIEKPTLRNSFTKESFIKKTKQLLIILPVMLLLGLAIFTYYEYKSLIPIGYSSRDLIGEDYTNVIEKLKESGFTDIETEKIVDLSLEDVNQNNKVSDVKIWFVKSFSEKTKLPSNFTVTITYHSLENVVPPYSSKEVKGMNYKEVIKVFKNAGFINVEAKKDYDLSLGWFGKDGEVKSVMIGDSKKFSKDDGFNPAEKVVITYHAWKKDKLKGD